MRIGILQPGYLPWLGFFEQLASCDIFVLYDDVQYDKNGWRNRNRVKTATGAQWLTVPVHVKFGEHPLVKDVIIDNKQHWRKKHLRSLQLNYGKAPYYQNYRAIFEETYAREWLNLVELDVHFIKRLADALRIDTGKIVLSSSLHITGDTIPRLIKICQHFKADVFYEGAAGKDYLNEEAFSEAGIKLEYQNYRHPVYRQLHGEFLPYLSVLDLLFNEGPNSLSILTNKFSEM